MRILLHVIAALAAISTADAQTRPKNQRASQPVKCNMHRTFALCAACARSRGLPASRYYQFDQCGAKPDK